MKRYQTNLISLKAAVHSVAVQTMNSTRLPHLISEFNRHGIHIDLSEKDSTALKDALELLKVESPKPGKMNFLLASLI
jgi:hypothetical protein